MTHQFEHPISADQGWIQLRGVRTHHLKNIDVSFPAQALTVVTGVSGSGKSSLVVDTLLRASQELFLEAMQVDLSDRQRAQLVADVDSVEGVLPCLAGLTPQVERRGAQSVASVAQLLRPLRGLFQSEGKLLCPSCGQEAEAVEVEHLVEKILTQHLDARLIVLARISSVPSLESLRQDGVLRVCVDQDISRLEELTEARWQEAEQRALVVDRLKVKADGRARLEESLRRAFAESDGTVGLKYDDCSESYSREPWCSRCEVKVASFNATHFDMGKPESQCRTCLGDGVARLIDPERLVEEPSLSLLEGAIGLLLQRTFRDIENQILRYCTEKKIAADKAFSSLSASAQRSIIYGDPKRGFVGLAQLLSARLREGQSQRVEQALQEYVVEESCSDCDGTGLSRALESYRLDESSLFEWFKKPLSEVLFYLENARTGDNAQAEGLYRSTLTQRLKTLCDLGLGHLELRRRLDSMSLGEEQRTRLVPLLSSKLTGLLIVFDEPTTGLHPSEVEAIWRRIEALKEHGNTVVVIEHKRSLWTRADWLIELGPRGGEFGGELIWQGPPCDAGLEPESMASQIASERKRKASGSLSVDGLSLRAIRDLELELPLGLLLGVSGVSGSGKTTLMVDGIGKQFRSETIKLTGEIPESVQVVAHVASGHSYSAPITFSGLLDPIRKWYSSLPESKLRGLSGAHFSFRRREGRCENCNGSGLESEELARYRIISRPCRVCQGRRFGPHTESVRYKGASIADVLSMNARQAYELFEKNKKIADILDQFIHLGLDYIPLGLATSSLSFGERQRLTLIRALAKSTQGKNLYIFDEPSRGLHDKDIEYLLRGFELLIAQGHSIFVIEHNQRILKNCDWHCVMGPGSGLEGGSIVYNGPDWTRAWAPQV